MANIEEFTQGLMWGVGIAIAGNAVLGLLVKSNTFPALTDFMVLLSQAQK